MNPTTGSDPLSEAISAFLTPLGLIVGFLALGIALAAIVSPRVRWIVLGLAIWASALESGQVDASETFVPARLMFPLEGMRQNARTITAALLLALVMPAVLSPRGWRRRLVMGGSIAFFVYELLFAMRIAGAGMFERAIPAIPVYALLFGVIACGLPRWLQSPEDAYRALRTVAFAGLIFAVTNTVQYLVDSSAASIHGRFSGTAGNPQHAATCIAVMLPCLLALVFRKQEPKLLRLTFFCTSLVLLVLMAMTGSRTGLLMLMLGVLVLFQKRLGMIAKVLAVGAIGLLLLAALSFSSTDDKSTADRLFSAEDTRSVVWSESLQEFKDHPLTGQMDLVVGIRESSYLSTAARMGLIGLIPMAVAFYLMVRTAWTLRSLRSQLGEHAILVDVAIAGLVTIWAGAVFEGYLLAVMSIHLMLVYMYLAFSAFLIDTAELQTLPATESIDGSTAYAAWTEMVSTA